MSKNLKMAQQISEASARVLENVDNALKSTLRTITQLSAVLPDNKTELKQNYKSICASIHGICQSVIIKEENQQTQANTKEQVYSP